MKTKCKKCKKPFEDTGLDILETNTVSSPHMYIAAEDDPEGIEKIEVQMQCVNCTATYYAFVPLSMFKKFAG